MKEKRSENSRSVGKREKKTGGQKRRRCSPGSSALLLSVGRSARLSTVRQLCLLRPQPCAAHGAQNAGDQTNAEELILESAVRRSLLLPFLSFDVSGVTCRSLVLQ